MKKRFPRYLIIFITLITCLMGFGNMAQAGVYWRPQTGNDSGDGSSAHPVKTWARAKELLATQGDDQWIYLTEELTVSSTTTMDGAINGKANARIKRNNGNGSGGVYMFRVNSGVTLTLKNILLDGRRQSSIPYPDDVRSMILTSGNVVLDNGTVLRDSWVKYEGDPCGAAVRVWDGGTLTMNAGSLISNCRTYKDGSTTNFRGGAIMSGASCTVTINGGTIENCYSMGWGGAISLAGGIYTFKMSGGTITGCHSDTNGGGIHIANDGGNMATATVNITGGTIDNCYADKGGGIYLECNSLNATMNAGTIKNCSAANGGGIYVTGGTATLSLSGGTIDHCTATSNGGGMYVNQGTTGNVTLNINGGTISYCSADLYGGGAYVEKCPNFTITNGKVLHCTCSGPNIADNRGRGGGLFISGTTLTMDGADAEIAYNHCKCYGGGMMTSSGSTFNFKNGKIHDNTAGNKRGTGTDPDTGYQYGGGGLSLDASILNMTGGELYNNIASTLGGAIHTSDVNNPPLGRINLKKGKIYNNIAYKQGGGINENTRMTIEFSADSDIEMYGNKSCVGGAILLDGGDLILRGSSFHDNEAHNDGDYGNNDFGSDIKGSGGAFGLITENGSNVHAPTFTLDGGMVTNNTAANKGGAIFLKAPTTNTSWTNTVTLSNGVMNNNSAGGGGGGALYVNRGNITINGGEICNNTAGGNGGGIYFDAASSMTVGAGDMNIKGNTANGIPNNVYLLSGKTIAVASDADFKPVYFGVYTADRTPDIPVFTGSETQLQNIYDGMLAVPATRNVVDDSQCFSPYLPSPQTTLYFGSSPWSPLQQTVRKSTDLVDADGDGYYDIGSVKQLTAFLWLVNGITTHDSNFSPAVPSAKGELTADFSMDGHYWVPFASYTGTFDGAGYIISDLTMVPTNVSTERGLFGVNASGTIKNVNLRDCFFAGGGSYIGTVVSQMNGGTLYNSVAQSEVEATATSTKAGGLVGHINGGTVHSCIATSEMTGYTMGGLAGKVSSGSLYNSFANPLFHYSGGSYFVGGLVAETESTGTVANCYVRFSRTQTQTGAKFGQLVGSNSGTVNPCYTPAVFTSDVPYTIIHTDTGSATSSTYKVADAPYLYNRPNDNLVGDTPLFKKLNEWVSANISSKPELAYWKRTTAGGWSYDYNSTTYTGGNINDDYPMLKMQGLSNVASEDGLLFDYSPFLSRVITKYNGLEGGGTVWVYASPKKANGDDESVSVANDGDVLLYIDEDAALLQADGNTLTAYTCQTLKTYPAERWHYFSSSLQESGIGFNYGTSSQVPFSWSENPCDVTFSADDDQALFPSDMPHINKVDLYCFYEPEYHWLNLKRNTASHWHMNAPTVPIAYIGNGTGGDGNETFLVPGKGYLVSIDQEQLVQNRGTLNNGDVTLHNVTKTDFNAWAGLLGYNLLGNPYQSYLDIEKFMAENSTALWGGAKDEASVRTYAVYDPETDCYLQYKRGVSRGARATSGLLNPHQGFLIRKTTTDSGSNTQVKFTNAMRSNDGTPSFREPQPAYPLVNVVLTDSQGRHDLVVLELGRNADEGVEKLRVGECSGRIGLALGSESYAILFRDETAEQQALRFEAEEEGGFTLRWETANAEFESLTLVDNIDGTTTDMLSRDSYSFEGSPDQYASRFKIVIGEYKGIEEPEVPEPVEGAACSFAYQTGDRLVVEGEGTLEVIDMLGRVVMTERLTDGQSRVRVPQTAGVYLLRLTGKNGTRTQKIVTK